MDLEEKLAGVLKNIPEWDTIAYCTWQALRVASTNPSADELRRAIKRQIRPKVMSSDDSRRMDTHVDAFVADKL